MRILFVIYLMMLGLVSEVERPSFGDATQAPPQVSLSTATFTRVDRVEAISSSVMESYAKLFPASDFDAPGLADPGGAWQCCCDFSTAGPPRRRLIFAGASPSLWFLYFEAGGNTIEPHFITFSIDSQGFATPLESLVFPRALNGVGDVAKLAKYAKSRAAAGRVGRW